MGVESEMKLETESPFFALDQTREKVERKLLAMNWVRDVSAIECNRGKVIVTPAPSRAGRDYTHQNANTTSHHKTYSAMLPHTSEHMWVRQG
jgi:hypothetical protein